MANADKPVFDDDTIDVNGSDLADAIVTSDQLNEELSFLFGRVTVEQANQIDIVDLNLNEKMLDCISTGVRKLKELKNNPQAQVAMVNEMEAGARIVLCMWIMDMGLLEKIQSQPYVNRP